MPTEDADAATPISSTKNSLLLEIEAPKVVDFVMAKQTHFYSLWGIYTVVEFTAGSYGMGQSISLVLAIAVLLGVWAFNLGHLGFVLQCVAQIRALKEVLKSACDNDKVAYEQMLKQAMSGIEEGAMFWSFFCRKGSKSSYIMNSAVHFVIDMCASAALLLRVDHLWPRLPFLRFG